MNIIALIPAKGNSNRLPNKNLYLLKGKPLLCWTIDAAKKSKYLHEIYVSTENKEIKKKALENNVKVIDRPLELSGNSIGKQEVLEHALSIIEKDENIDVICMLQANSPELKHEKIDEAIEKIINSNGKVWDCISINKETLFTDGAIRVFQRHCVNEKGIGMYKAIVLTDYIDVHYMEDVKTIETRMDINKNV